MRREEEERKKSTRQTRRADWRSKGRMREGIRNQKEKE